MFYYKLSNNTSNLFQGSIMHFLRLIIVFCPLKIWTVNPHGLTETIAIFDRRNFYFRAKLSCLPQFEFWLKNLFCLKLGFWRKIWFLTKILIFDQNFDSFDKISIFWPTFRCFDQNFDVLTNISIFDQNFDVLTKISNFWPKFRFFWSIFLFDQNFDVWPKFRLFTEIGIFDQNFYFWPRNYFRSNFLFWTFWWLGVKYSNFLTKTWW